MAVHYIRPNLAAELRDPFDSDEQVVKALVTVGAFVALADGRLDAIERDEAVRYIDQQQLAPTISRRRIADFDGALLTFSTHKHAISREETLAI
jgi:tellurite resistance protein